MDLTDRVALVTGAAKRLGAASATALHAAGAKVIVHYHRSEEQAKALVEELNGKRDQSAVCLGTELGSSDQAQWCIQQSMTAWNRLDIVVNNASSFFPTPIGEIDGQAVNDLIASNVTAPLFLVQAALPELSKRNGVVVNMADIHGLHPHRNHAVYSAAKAALIMLTRSMALELAPKIRVNAIAPGAILWPENDSIELEAQQEKISAIPLQRCGSPEDIADLLVYLCSDKAKYITGEVVKVDGGRAL